MRIYTKAGDLAFREFTFPDGQPHFELLTDTIDFNEATIEVAIKTSTDLFNVLMVNDVLKHLGYIVNLDVRYLMGARMDRPINSHQPFTLQTVCRMINAGWFRRVRLFDVHSDIATRLLYNAHNILPYGAVRQVFRAVGSPVYVVRPDKGADERVRMLANLNPSAGGIIKGEKTRDSQTGKISGFKVSDTPRDLWNALILDDICDGGGTFVGLAKELRKAGAAKVFLFVTHNVQGKKYLEGIDKIYTTDTFKGPDVASGPWNTQETCVIPISMKDL